MQGYLPVKMLADTIRGTTTVDLSAGGFLDAGTEIVTADSVQEPFDLPPLTFDELEALAASPEAAREYYQPLVDGPIADWADEHRAHRERVAVGRTGRPVMTQRIGHRRRRRRSPSPVCARRTAGSWPSRAWISPSRPAPSTPSSARTVPASPR